MKKFFTILSLFILPVRLRSVRLPIDALRSRRLP
jgi:hypothetical protein